MKSLVGVLAAVLLAACYETPKPPCMFLCGTDGACPSGYVCVAEDNRCHRDDEGGPAACPDDLPQDDDAAVDGPVIDATLIDAMIDAEPIDAMLIDAEPIDALVCPPALNPAADGSTTGAPQTLVISEINPGDYIELYNNTGAAIDLDNVAFQLCSPFNYAAVATVGAGITIPAGSYAELPWPAGFTDVDAGGEVILYADSQFAVAASVMDFVCWGTNPHGSRKALAETADKWTDGAPCVSGSLTMGALHRLVGTDGIDAADYSAVLPPSPVTCTP